MEGHNSFWAHPPTFEFASIKYVNDKYIIHQSSPTSYSNNMKGTYFTFLETSNQYILVCETTKDVAALYQYDKST